jgi:putative nucleotidyltransferase with HDIG domain
LCERARSARSDRCSLLGTMFSVQSDDPSGLVARARWTAREQLQPLGDRWAHVQGVARVAEQLSRVVGPPDRDYLVAAALLHDVGYSPAIARTGFHPLDGARYLAQRGEDWRLCCLVAHHSAARYEARARNLDMDLAAFDREEGSVVDALVYADMTTGPTGKPMSVEARFNDIRDRYAGEDPVSRALLEAEPDLHASIERTLERLRSH